jgi:acetoin utilization deacetylase AcuC-like enzyme
VAVSIVRDARFRAHEAGPGHPECPERLDAIDRALADSGLGLVEVPSRPAQPEELLRVHDPSLVQRLEGVRGRAVSLDPDTATSPGSVDAAFLAAGGTIDLALQIARKEAPPGMALVRPPGHHATRDRAMGFCLLNNVAIATAALRATGLASRVAIYDWDVHHGNGTEAIFYEDPEVLYLSTHQWPQYPGTGARSHTGRGKGEGATVNVPLPAGTDDETLLAVTDQILAPKVRAFRPDMILISAGFDPYEQDPIGGFQITVGGFKALAERWRDLAGELCEGKIAATLEGGYHLEGLGASVRAVLEAWDR